MSAQESKPEWFHMADEDWAANPKAAEASSAQGVRKSPLRVMAFSLPVMALAAGLFLAQSQDAPQSFAAGTSTVATAPVTNTPVAQGDAVQSATPVANSPVANTPVASAPEDMAPVASTPVTTSPAVNSPKVAPSAGSSALSTLNTNLALPAKGSVQSGDDNGRGDDDNEGDDD